jgi:hypothetical protein
MAGFEIIVRPVVFPDIRPAPAQPVPAADDPEKGFATIRGNGGKQISLSTSYSSSLSSSVQSETKRRVDVQRVYQKEESGKINRKNFVDLEVANKIWSSGAPANFRGFTGDDVVPTYPGRGYTGDDVHIHYYQRMKDEDNIETLEKDRIKKKEQG